MNDPINCANPGRNPGKRREIQCLYRHPNKSKEIYLEICEQNNSSIESTLFIGKNEITTLYGFKGRNVWDNRNDYLNYRHELMKKINEKIRVPQ